MNPKLQQGDLDQLETNNKAIQQNHDALLGTTRTSP